MAASEKEKSPNNWADLGFKFLSVLVIPLLAVGTTMWSDASVLRERVAQVQALLSETRTRSESIETRLTQISLTAEETHGQLRELRAILDLLRERLNGVHSSGERSGR